MTTSFNTLLRDDCLVDAMLGFFSSHRRHRRVPPATAPELLLPAPLPETRQQMEVQQGNRNCNHSLKREKPARCAGIPLEPLNECCLAVKRMPLAARRAWNGTAEALSRTSQAVPR